MRDAGGIADLFNRSSPSAWRCDLPCLSAYVPGRSQRPRLLRMSRVQLWREIVAERPLRCWSLARAMTAPAALGAIFLTLAVDARGQAAGGSEENPVVRELPGQASPASPGFGSNTGSANEAVLDLRRQVNDLRSDLLDEREPRIDRRQQASGTALAVLAALIGIGGLWACAKFRAIAREARIGGAAARALSTAFPGQAPRIPRAGIRCRGAIRLSRTARPARARTYYSAVCGRDRQWPCRHTTGWER